MPKLIYLRNPADFASAYGSEDLTKLLVSTINFFDYAGGICLPRETAEKTINFFPHSISSKIYSLIHNNGGNIHFRSGGYYLNFTCKDDSELLQSVLPKYLKEVTHTIDELDIKPISKLRYIGRVIKFIKENNLRGIL